MSAPDPRIASLPAVPRQLARELGYEMGVKLMIEFGGMQIQVPQRPQPKQAIWKALGEPAAKVMSELYGGLQIEVPVGAALTAAARNRAIAAHPGSHNEAARDFGVTRRWVRIVRRADRSPGPLFEKAK